MLANITNEMLAAVGAKTAAEFQDKISTFAKTAQENASAMAQNQVTLESLQASITALEGKLISEDRIKEICGESATASIATWAGSEAGKKIMGAEASRITAEALANVGTTPAKPAPAAAGGETPEQKAAALVAAGKYEEAYALDATAKRDFISAKTYAAYMKANGQGAVRITTKN